MKKCIKLSAGLFAACLFLVAGPIQAAKAPKVDICHFDADEGIFKPISVSGNALQPHLENHGDQLPGVDPGTGAPIMDEECLVVMAPPDVLARAYIDVDRSGDYDGTVDVEIAQLLDSDGSGGPSVGDNVLLGQYPKTFDPCPLPTADCPDLGNFAPGPFPVTAVLINTPGQIDVATNGSLEYFWDEAVEREVFGNRRLDVSVNFISDERSNDEDPDDDRIAIEMGGEANPSDLVVTNQTAAGDDYFLNVEIPAAP